MLWAAPRGEAPLLTYADLFAARYSLFHGGEAVRKGASRKEFRDNGRKQAAQALFSYKDAKPYRDSPSLRPRSSPFAEGCAIPCHMPRARRGRPGLEAPLRAQNSTLGGNVAASATGASGRPDSKVE